MAERYANNFRTTLNGGISSSDTSLTLAEAVPADLEGGSFRLVIGTEIVIVGSASGTSCTDLTRGAEDTTAAAHLNGESVTHVLTRDSLKALIAGSPDELQFQIVGKYTIAEFMPSGLQLFAESFAADTGQFTRYSESTQATFSLSGGQGVITNSSGTARNDVITVGADLTIPQVAVQIDIVSRTGTLSGYSNIGVGIAKDANNFVWANYDAVANQVRIQLKIAGVSTFNAAVSKTLTPGYKLGFSLVANSACAWVDTGSGWAFVTGYAIPTATVNFKTTSLTGWKPAWTVATPNNQVWTFDNFTAGRYGSFGIRDINVVTYEDGTPYITGGVAYATATVQDGMGFAGSYQAVFTVDLATYALTQTAVIFIDRGSAKQNDVAAHIMYYGTGDRRICITTWGNGFSGVIDIYHKLFSGTDILSGTHLLGGLAKLNVPEQAAGYAAYDPCLVKNGSTWLLAHSLCENTSFAGDLFYPAMATSTDLSTWASDGNDRSSKQYEGTRLIRMGQSVADYFVAAGGRSLMRCYDKSMNFRGFIRATVDGGAVTQPHPMIFYNPAADKWVMLTFDQQKPTGITATFTWGRMVVHEATP